MLNRRRFLQQSLLAAGACLAPRIPYAAEPATRRLTILHTNDTHSRLEAFPMDGSRNQGLGGVAARARIIREIRQQEEQVLLLDAGDIFQGTPYFNIYKGEPEIKAMQQMGYDACTMGNHDFDGGLENFATQMQHATFPVVLCNYDFSETPMEHKYLPYKIFRKGDLKVGITGAGIELKGLVPDNLAGKTRYLDPVQAVNEVAELLKRKKGCDLVICLSHLGYQYRENPGRMCDTVLARETELVDLIIGGHTHTFLNEPVVVKNKTGSDVVVNQVGWAGIILGRLDFEFSSGKKKNLLKAHTVVVGKKSSE
jgi:5'-nucleotidase